MGEAETDIQLSTSMLWCLQAYPSVSLWGRWVEMYSLGSEEMVRGWNEFQDQ
jgi:hypothetical protein